MNQFAQNSYVQTQILTATPQKLRLMLIEGAIRFARRTIEAWETGDVQVAATALVRCRDIIAELLASIRADESELARDVASIYWFLFQTLTTALASRSTELLNEVLRVLEVERETWQQLCEKMPQAPRVECVTNKASPAIPPTTAPTLSTGIASQTSSVSFDA